MTEAGFCVRIALAALLLPGAASAAAREVPGEVEQRALARARTALVDAVLRGDHPAIAAWATADPEREVALRTWLWMTPRYGPARAYRTGEVAVDLRLELRQLRARIRELDPTTPPAEDTAPDILWITGRASVDEAAGTGPPGWENVTEEGRALVREAAVAAAWADVLDRLATVPGRAADPLRSALENPRIYRNLLVALPASGAREVSLPACQVCVAHVSIDATAFVAALAAHADLPERDLREVPLIPNLAALLRGTGRATPPDTLRSHWPPAAPTDAPAWAARVLRVVVESADADADPRIAAIEPLHAKVARLQLADGRIVGDLLTDEAELEADLRLCLGAGRVTSSVPDEGITRTTVEVALDTVWRLIAPAVPTSQPTSQPTSVESDQGKQ